jgi:hypothetical protein
MINKYTNNYFVFIFESIIAINILDIHSKLFVYISEEELRLLMLNINSRSRYLFLDSVRQ